MSYFGILQPIEIEKVRKCLKQISLDEPFCFRIIFKIIIIVSGYPLNILCHFINVCQRTKNKKDIYGNVRLCRNVEFPSSRSEISLIIRGKIIKIIYFVNNAPHLMTTIKGWFLNWRSLIMDQIIWGGVHQLNMNSFMTIEQNRFNLD